MMFFSNMYLLSNIAIVGVHVNLGGAYAFWTYHSAFPFFSQVAHLQKKYMLVYYKYMFKQNILVFCLANVTSLSWTNNPRENSTWMSCWKLVKG